MPKIVKFNPGEKVFAKVRGYPPWPARIEDETVAGRSLPPNKYHLFFYGTHEIGVIQAKNLFPYEPNKNKYGVPQKRKFFNEALEEIVQNPDVPAEYPHDKAAKNDVNHKSEKAKVTKKPKERVDAKESDAENSVDESDSDDDEKPLKEKTPKRRTSTKADSKDMPPSTPNSSTKAPPDVLESATSRSGRIIKKNRLYLDDYEDGNQLTTSPTKNKNESSQDSEKSKETTPQKLEEKSVSLNNGISQSSLSPILKLKRVELSPQQKSSGMQNYESSIVSEDKRKRKRNRRESSSSSSDEDKKRTKRWKSLKESSDSEEEEEDKKKTKSKKSLKESSDSEEEEKKKRRRKKSLKESSDSEEEEDESESEYDEKPVKRKPRKKRTSTKPDSKTVDKRKPKRAIRRRVKDSSESEGEEPSSIESPSSSNESEPLKITLVKKKKRRVSVDSSSDDSEPLSNITSSKRKSTFDDLLKSTNKTTPVKSKEESHPKPKDAISRDKKEPEKDRNRSKDKLKEDSDDDMLKSKSTEDSISKSKEVSSRKKKEEFEQEKAKSKDRHEQTKDDSNQKKERERDRSKARDKVKDDMDDEKPSNDVHHVKVKDESHVKSKVALSKKPKESEHEKAKPKDKAKENTDHVKPKEHDKIKEEPIKKLKESEQNKSKSKDKSSEHSSDVKAKVDSHNKSRDEVTKKPRHSEFERSKSKEKLKEDIDLSKSKNDYHHVKHKEDARAKPKEEPSRTKKEHKQDRNRLRDKKGKDPSRGKSKGDIHPSKTKDKELVHNKSKDEPVKKKKEPEQDKPRLKEKRENLANHKATKANVSFDLSNLKKQSASKKVSPDKSVDDAVPPIPVKVITPVTKLLTYPPPPQTGGIGITSEDLSCLDEGKYVNDTIIAFYLKYLMNEKLSEADRQRTHIFSSFFYPRLTNVPGKNEEGCLAQKRHSQVKTWTKNVDIFKKDFIIIPINQNVHWFLAIICFPGLVPFVQTNTSPGQKSIESVTSTIDQESCKSTGVLSGDLINDVSQLRPSVKDQACNTDESISGENSDLNSMVSNEAESNYFEEPIPEAPDSSTHPDRHHEPPKKMPCILIFDSLCGPNRWRIVNMLREYLDVEWRLKKGTARDFSKFTMQGHVPHVPQQTNYSDCGIYLLQYVESFFEDPFPYFASPMPELPDWFPDEKVLSKRGEIKTLISDLQKRNPCPTPTTPNTGNVNTSQCKTEC